MKTKWQYFSRCNLVVCCINSCTFLLDCVGTRAHQRGGDHSRSGSNSCLFMRNCWTLGEREQETQVSRLPLLHLHRPHAAKALFVPLWRHVSGALQVSSWTRPQGKLSAGVCSLSVAAAERQQVRTALSLVSGSLSATHFHLMTATSFLHWASGRVYSRWGPQKRAENWSCAGIKLHNRAVSQLLSILWADCGGGNINHLNKRRNQATK